MSSLKFYKKTTKKVFKESIYSPTNNPKLGPRPITNLTIKRPKNNNKNVVAHYKSKNRPKIQLKIKINLTLKVD